jgi:NAD(P)-dependent dehydrogenase (short-subunit alcohol dehydrogenase family)
LTCNVLERKGLERASDAVLERSGRINILVNGAGGNHPSATTDPEEDVAFFDLPEEGFRKTFDLNFTGTVLCCQVFGKAMLEFGPGSIINIASMSGFTPLTRVPAYSAAKAAILNFTRWLAVDMAKHYSPRLRVNAVAPGFFHTKQNHFLLYDERGENRALTERGRTIMTHTPMTRFGRENDLIGATVWLASEGSAFVTGTVVIVDGGFCAFSGV